MNKSDKLNVYMYTKGTGSGHLTRINAVYKGFVRAGYKLHFYASAHRSKYKHFLNPAIKLCEKDEFPKSIDIFICDWRTDDYIDSLPTELSKLWVGLRRLGKMPSPFPSHFYVVAIEPNVKGDTCIWPIIYTYPDELQTKQNLNDMLNLDTNEKPIALLCENGAYKKHIDIVFDQEIENKFKIIKCSNSPFSENKRHISYYPIAEFFRATDFLIIGGGYNSVHEALCYADLKNTRIIKVGGDDQLLRINKHKDWPIKDSSQSHILARQLFDILNNDKA